MSTHAESVKLTNTAWLRRVREWARQQRRAGKYSHQTRRILYGVDLEPEAIRKRLRSWAQYHSISFLISPQRLAGPRSSVPIKSESVPPTVIPLNRAFFAHLILSHHLGDIRRPL